MSDKNKYYTAGVIVIVIIIALIMWARPSSQTPAESPATSGTPAAATPKPSASVPVYTPPPAPKPAPAPAPAPAPSADNVPFTLPPKGTSVYYTPASTTAKMIQVSNPPANTSVYSPITISGQALGSWYFEAVFPVLLADANGKIIAQGQAKALGNWQTPGFVPFMATLAFPRQLTGSVGYLILKRDNPSGLAANDASVQIAVVFQ